MFLINEVSKDDIKLNSFKQKSKLNDKIWDEDNTLLSKIRLRLLDICDDFIEELSIDVKPIDIVFCGSLANYNWSSYSDIDLHIVFDFKKVLKKDPELIEDYFKAKRDIWKQTHSKLKIYGFPVEISIENTTDNIKSKGRYSLYKSKWLNEPVDLQDAKLNQDFIKTKSSKIVTEIDNLKKRLDKETDKHKIGLINKKAVKTFKMLKDLRKEGLNSKKGEMSSGNIIYKVIRRMKRITKLFDIINVSYDKSNSLD